MEANFAQVIAGIGSGPDGWTVDVPEDWLVGRTCFGGLQAAATVRAARGLVGEEIPLRSLQVAFVGPVPAGRSQLEARILRSGKSVTHTEVRIVRGTETLCLAFVIFGHPRTSAVRVDPQMPPPARSEEESRPLGFFPGLSPEFAKHFEFRWAQGGFPFTGAKEPHTQIYARHRETQALGESHLIAMCDSIPSPGVSMLTRFARGASLTWTLEILEHQFDFDPDRYWRLDAEITAGRDGYHAESVAVWNPDGRMAALSRQTAMIFD
jgi:acyl-CoA thioesterase